MSSPNCGTAHERGSFCDRCGRRLPVTQTIRRVTLPRRPSARRGPGRTTNAGAVQAPDAAAGVHVVVGEEVGTSQLAEVGRMYDTAMKRAAVHGHRPLQRYLSVLIEPS